MKVICAGFSKTGTKTMQAALKELGYNVYDFMENYKYLGNDWMKIFGHGGTTEDFYRMFENVDAVTDVPACCFWDEIHKAFPDAKIIFTTRNEQAWFRSWDHQWTRNTQPMFSVMRLLSPTLYRLNSFIELVVEVMGVKQKKHWLQPNTYNKLLARMSFRRHNAHVLLNAPKDKLLVYNVKEGWEPLCKFLGVDVPSKPFPHKNVRGSIVEEALAKDPVLIRGQREFLFTAAAIAVLVPFGVYKTVNYFRS
ncbi:unnamed protein product [Clavelina lepadiformis]|uniref:Sulfotransferase family protein n=1 Tax=Clavelina lepadiformis TaxID=159417 RepID=A0ABP0GSL2_CLALP